MQKDFHFYVTYALARSIRINKTDAQLIAWANQYTDELKRADLYGIQTQAGTLGNWGDEQIQFTVLIPFHFIPGDDPAWPWKTTEKSRRALELVRRAEESKDPIRLGMALHMLQDTFSHQGFSGWREERNSCYPWYHMMDRAPNVGHAEMRTIPDQIEEVWKDPRDEAGGEINNRERCMGAAQSTFESLVRWQQFAKPVTHPVDWDEIRGEISRIFEISRYDDRKQELRKLSGQPDLRYSKITKSMEKRRISDFVRSATVHLSEASSTYDSLPRV